MLGAGQNFKNNLPRAGQASRRQGRGLPREEEALLPPRLRKCVWLLGRQLGGGCVLMPAPGLLFSKLFWPESCQHCLRGNSGGNWPRPLGLGLEPPGGQAPPWLCRDSGGTALQALLVALGSAVGVCREELWEL